MCDHEPDVHGDHLREASAGGDPVDGERGYGEYDEMTCQVQRARAIAAPEMAKQRSSSHAGSNLSSRTHLVLCTPGTPGTITRAGKPWSSERSAPLTRRASNARSSLH